VPPTTVWIIDLECSECTEKVETPSLEYFDLIGVVPPEGELVQPQLPFTPLLKGKDLWDTKTLLGAGCRNRTNDVLFASLLRGNRSDRADLDQRTRHP
jgi:hypothetical protein